ncbi:flagellar hook-basal body protein FliE [Aliarcobacter thereius]|uniref:Flagellar hook-basal body complex protein FliE n=2 Tax=Aliarcobacter thereius TaxID=544718 RepID=A0A1C0B964_9BACT|nr:flagellar hook-basal body complex protein FliE [Aliarcobacter thereius]OCL88743.1 flagellar hook-basal body protein FliE [Aliarcobacter thereius]OCL92238.1 flagellar hook-basal body protein FliE [Aliarcobacter thereius]OCL94666.1 flagellar hook-basal body protein FliE [Aliarcobacter thereius LMG 24486]OCM00112.1 flagellar hook-basal body protein FliE [Aliarcobacter thereius]QBF15458.1 flagellar proximal rod protein FliE [Aliarcobacter thereius LMG 24486]
MQIGSINFLDSLEQIKGDKVQNSTQKIDESNYANKSFKDMLNSAVNDVNDAQITGYNSMKDIATGKVENLQEAVQRIEEAELSLKLGLEVKNKAINAYREIMRMQI